MSTEGDAPKRKDCWDKLDIIGKVLIPILLGYATYSLNTFTASQQVESQRLARRDQTVQASAQLQHGREVVETQLRGSMFGKILDKYSQDTDEQSQVLYLELLVENFSQSLELSPIARDVRRRVQQSNLEDPLKETLLARIRVALENAKVDQLFTIASAGAAKTFRMANQISSEREFALQYCETKGTENSYPLRIPIRFKIMSVLPDDNSISIQLTNFKRVGGTVVQETSDFTVEPTDLPLIDNILIAPGVRLAFSIGSNNLRTATDIPIQVFAFPDSTPSARSSPEIKAFLKDVDNSSLLNPATTSGIKHDECSDISRSLSFASFRDSDEKSLPLAN